MGDDGIPVVAECGEEGARVGDDHRVSLALWRQGEVVQILKLVNPGVKILLKEDLVSKKKVQSYLFNNQQTRVGGNLLRQKVEKLWRQFISENSDISYSISYLKSFTMDIKHIILILSQVSSFPN